MAWSFCNTNFLVNNRGKVWKSFTHQVYIVKMAHPFSPETFLSSQWCYSNSRGFGQTTSLCTPGIELELEVRQRFGPLTLSIIRFSDASMSSLYIYYDLCLISTLIDYITREERRKEQRKGTDETNRGKKRRKRTKERSREERTEKRNRAKE